jgi:hypothetical protein
LDFSSESDVFQLEYWGIFGFLFFQNRIVFASKDFDFIEFQVFFERTLLFLVSKPVGGLLLG